MTAAGAAVRADVRSWGRVGRGDCLTLRPRFIGDLDGRLTMAAAPYLAVGARRSYGDSGMLRDGLSLDMTGLNRFRSFDPATGVLTADAGVLLADVMAAFAPRGWFPPTSPGTRFVTLGGAVANDVHGKNHHLKGTFGRHVTSLRLHRSDLGALEVSPAHRPDLFAATIGGLGLTGVIEAVSVRLQPIASTWLQVETIALNGLDDFFAVSDDSSGFEHTVAWIDCTATGAALGRGVFSRADWMSDGRLDPHADGRLRVPLQPPVGLFHPLTLGPLNGGYRWSQLAKPKAAPAHYASVFHPLDAVGGWNLLYGPAGFYQYQCVTPADAGRAPLRRLLEIVAASGDGSTLAVLKTFGDQPSPGLMSFPMAGYTLALDFANRGPRTLHLLSELDAVVAQAGGRLYAAKDGRMSPTMFRAGYPALADFLNSRDLACQSDFATRMQL